MAGGIFAVLDDIAVLLDDVAVMGKLAARQTAGLLSDDLAVNAEKATGFRPSRELPVLWAITKGSFLNKIIILPLAFLLSAYAPWLIVPVLLLGGSYLSYEGMEKIYHLFVHKSHEKPVAKQVESKEELLRIESGKIKSAIRTDFILSIEIVMVTLGTVMSSSFAVQVLVVTLIAFLATVGVYGLVALIVRMDDVGFYLIACSEKTTGWKSSTLRWCGEKMTLSLPWIIRGLSIIGTIAMLLVGGGLFLHNIAPLHHALHFLPSILSTLLCGFVVGSLVLIGQLVIKHCFLPEKKN